MDEVRALAIKANYPLLWEQGIGACRSVAHNDPARASVIIAWKAWEEAGLSVANGVEFPLPESRPASDWLVCFNYWAENDLI